ncbi:OB-fold protein [Aquimarina sp. LLG6339-5]|uniref:OB-fold protein n=1 Tax=Aquimarina sp. LLG6339-5 TaxID=3160830 RepID=UPI0038676809
MNRKNKIIIFLFGLLLMVGAYVYIECYNTSHIDIINASTEISTDSQKLTASFISNENDANLIYKDKIVELVGVVKEVTFLNNRNTIVLEGENKNSSVLCDMQSDQLRMVKNLKKGQKIELKGVCKGFLKDVILLNCMLINQ